MLLYASVIADDSSTLVREILVSFATSAGNMECTADATEEEKVNVVPVVMAE